MKPTWRRADWARMIEVLRGWTQEDRESFEERLVPALGQYGLVVRWPTSTAGALLRGSHE
jgi:hypothetical protein